MKTLLGERGQIVIPKKIRDSLQVQKGDELEIDMVEQTIVLRPVKRFKAKDWRDYAGIADGIADSYLEEKEQEKRIEDVCP